MIQTRAEGRARLCVMFLAVAAVAVAAALLLPSPATAHAQLLSSSPGSGELVATAPTEARLVFSEPGEPGYTSADLLDGEGRVMGLRLGAMDPADPRQLVVPLPPLADGVYSLAWRAVSAADGHGTSGFLTFAVGSTPLPPGVGGYDPGTSGDIHSGHSGTTALAETQGRAASYLGFMLALGFAVVGSVALAPVIGRVPTGVVQGQAAALLVAGFGSGLLGLVGGEAFGSTEGGAASSTLGSLAYLVDSRTGLLLLGRIAVAMPFAVAVFLLARPRPRIGLLLGGIGGVAGIALTVAGSHAAAFDSVAPVVSQGLHVAAAGIWLSGVVVLAGGVVVRLFERGQLEPVVRRFSALALVSIALLSATGIYAVWVETGQLLSLEGGYSTVLAVKVGVFLAAVGLGALNYLERPRALIRRLPFGTRVSVEATLGVTVVIATALLASSTPPAATRPVQLAPAAAETGGSVTAGSTLGVQPARPGPNRFTVELGEEPPEGGRVELRLQRLDVDQGTSIVALTRVPGAATRYAASDGSIAPYSRWDATVVVLDEAGVEIRRRRFGFAVDATGVSEGRLLPPLDPALAIAIALIASGILGLSFAVAGGRLPRTDAAASRISVLAGGAAALVVGIVMTLGGPRP